jgi:hypothetical protein
MKPLSSSHIRYIIGLGLSLLIPSLGIIQKFLGTPFLPVYLIGGWAIISIGYHVIPWKTVFALNQTQVSVLSSMTCVALIVLFAVVYPLADSGRIGPGSDHDDALNRAVTEMIHGRYPYYPRTYLDGPITKLPGALLLAAPFVLIGTSAYQNIVWLGLFVVGVSKLFHNTMRAMVVLWTILLLSPVIWQRFVTGGDLLANNIYVLLFALFLISSMHETNTTHWTTKQRVAATLFGIGLSSRVHFLLLVPLMFTTLRHIAGTERAIRTITWSLCIFVCCTLPFYVYDPNHFAPRELFTFLKAFDNVIPYGHIFIILGSIIVACILSYQPTHDVPISFLARSALIQAFPVLCGIVFSSIEYGTIQLSFADFGINFLFFGTLAATGRLFEQCPQKTTPGVAEEKT